jgi:cobalt-zinc-cadmium resistance protein CzcA
MGVAVQTSVNLHSFINKLRLEGEDIASATHEASLLRLRPIMMTALVACLGLLPAAMSTGIGSDSQKPFAIVIVGGHGVDIACFAMLVHFIGEYARSRHRV